MSNAPPIMRKQSAPIVPDRSTGLAPSSGSSFYNGPTVPMDLAKQKRQVEAKVAQGNAAIKRNAQNIKTKVQSSSLPQHTFLNSLVITLSLLSLFSLQFCPPPSLITSVQSTSPAFRYNPLQAPLTVPKWEEVICTPTNYYRSTILEPYIVPRLKARFGSLKAHPVVTAATGAVTPHYNRLSTHFPLIKRTSDQAAKSVRAIYAKQVVPALSLAQKRYDLIARRVRYKLRPHTDRWDDMIAHHKRGISTLQGPAFFSTLSDGGAFALEKAQWAGGIASTHAKIGADKVGKSAWDVSGVAGKKFGPRVIDLVEVSLDTAENLWAWGLSQLQLLYNQHLHTHVQPHLSTIDSKLYTPHLKDRLNPLFPVLASFVAAPSYPEIRRNLKDVKSSLQGVPPSPAGLKEKVVASAKSVVDAITPSHVVVAAKTAQEEDDDLAAYFASGLTAGRAGESREQRKNREKAEKGQRKEVRAEVDENLDELSKRVALEGKKQESTVQAEFDKIVDFHVKSTASSILQKRISSIQKESARIVKAYGKYVTSLDLNVSEKPIQKELRADVVEAGDKAVSRVDGLWEHFRTDCEDGLLVQGAVDKADAVIEEAVKKVEASYIGDQVKLGRKLSYFNGVTSSDWSRFHGITTAAGAWRERYQSLLYGALASSRALQGQAINEVADALKPFKNDIIDIEKDAITKLGGSPSILPIRVPNLASIKDAADMAIGKSKEQVVQAIAQAQSVAGYAAPSEPVGIVNIAQASASSLAEQAQSVYSSATRSASILAGVTPTPESVPEHISSVAAVAASSASSLASVASKSIASVAAVAATPDSYQASAQSALSAASSVYHQATRSASSAVGATPSPETVPESVESAIAAVSSAGESVLDEIVSTASSVYTEATSIGGFVLEELASTASSVYTEASSAVIAPVATPVSSIIAEVSSTASSLVVEASSAAAPYVSEASSVVHDATRSAIRAVGATPAPERFADHVESLTDAAKSSAASVAAQASSSYSSVTRAASKAAGATPTAETLEDRVEDLLEGMAGFGESAASAAEVAASSVSSVASEGMQIVKAAVGRDEL